jgi:hypothetical protein
MHAYDAAINPAHFESALNFIGRAAEEEPHVVLAAQTSLPVEIITLIGNGTAVPPVVASHVAQAIATYGGPAAMPVPWNAITTWPRTFVERADLRFIIEDWIFEKGL